MPSQPGGYFIYPSQLFANVAKNTNTNESLNTDFAKIFAEIDQLRKDIDAIVARLREKPHDAGKQIKHHPSGRAGEG